MQSHIQGTDCHISGREPPPCTLGVDWGRSEVPLWGRPLLEDRETVALDKRAALGARRILKQKHERLKVTFREQIAAPQGVSLRPAPSELIGVAPRYQSGDDLFWKTGQPDP